MGKILVFIESNRGKIKRSSQELLSIAKASGQAVVGVAFGSQSESVAQESAGYGVEAFYLVGDAALNQYNPELFTLAMVDIISAQAPNLVLATASALGKDLFPRVAARLDAGIVTDCTEIEIRGDSCAVKRPVYSGRCFSKVELLEETKLKIVLMRPNQVPILIPTAGDRINVVSRPFLAPPCKTLVRDVVKGTSEKLDLTEANIIVSGGRGLKEVGNFKLLQQLADVLGATVGASRAVVDAGWVGHEMQVGQTGKTVAPSLYIAVGISGAIQHLAGMSGSKVIVAINTDSNAPIFQKATYGIVGDFSEIIPLLTEEFRKELS